MLLLSPLPPFPANVDAPAPPAVEAPPPPPPVSLPPKGPPVPPLLPNPPAVFKEDPPVPLKIPPLPEPPLMPGLLNTSEFTPPPPPFVVSESKVESPPFGDGLFVFARQVQTARLQMEVIQLLIPTRQMAVVVV